MPKFRALKPTSYMPADSVEPVQVGTGEVIEAPQSPGYSFKPLDPEPPPRRPIGPRLPNGVQSSRRATDFLPDGTGNHFDGTGNLFPHDRDE